MWIKENKIKIARAVRAAVFLVILVVLVTFVSGVLEKKSSKQKLLPFFQEGENYDVLFLGISHMQVGVFPMELWDDYGIASFNFGESGTRLPWSYWVLKNALDYTNPSLVVVDTRRLEIESIDYYQFVRTNFDEFPLSKNKIAAAIDLFETWDERLNFLFPILQYHNRWSELTAADFGPVDCRTNKGARHYDGNNLHVAVPSAYKIISEDKKDAPGAVGDKYLRQIIELCQSRGIKVLLTELPYPANTKSQRLANGVQDIADEYGIDYINFLHMEDIVNFNTDMNDSGHMNDSGARKVTDYLGRFITENYEIPDHRNDEEYASWYGDYETYKAYKYERLRTQSKMDNILMLSSDQKLNYCIRVDGSSGILNDERMLQLIENMSQQTELSLLRTLPGTGLDYYLVVNNSEGKVWESTEGFANLEAGFAEITCGKNEGIPYMLVAGNVDNLFVPADEEGKVAKLNVVSFDGTTGELVSATAHVK